MADLPNVREKITVEETSYRSGVSEATWQKIGSSMNWILDNSSFQLGDIIPSALTEAQFQAERGTGWVRMTGQNIAGSDLEALTGIQDLPDMVGNGAHLEQLESGNSMFDYFASQNKEHNHGNGAWNRVLRETGVNTVGDIDASVNEPEVTSSRVMTNNGGTVARPNSYQINFFILINF
jgi:hypothetical protein